MSHYLSIYFGYHDTNISISDESTVLLHLEAERFFRRKHMRINSLDELNQLVNAGLRYTGLSINDIDNVLISKWNNLFNGGKVNILGKNFLKPVYTGHHNNHLGTLLTSSKDILVCADGGSEDGFSGIYNKVGNKYNKLENLDKTILNGKFYGTITQIIIEPKCSKAHNHDAGKTMGLASYGKYSKEFAQLINENESELNKLHFDGCNHLRQKFGISDDYSMPWKDQRRCDLAYTAQYTWVDKFFKKLSNYADKSKTIALSGGCALNVVLNSKLASSGLFKQVYISPVSNDSGQSIGALMNYNPNLNLQYPFLGRGFGEIDAYPESLTDDMISGKIIAWYQGRSESGSRALGHRSFIGLPSTNELRDRLSVDIKKREPYRPVAPIVAHEYVEDYFKENFNSPFMTFNYTAKTYTKQKCPAIVHVDGTSRVQTLKQNDNPIIHKLLMNLNKLNYPPIIMNTSFNVAGEPIVDTPADAFRQFKVSNADILYINGKRYTQSDIKAL